MKASYEARDRYLYVRTEGSFSLSAARKIFFEWIDKARSLALSRILCDITPLVGYDTVTTTTQFEISTFVVESIPRDFMLAFLGTQEQIVNAKFGENVMVNRGLAAKVTTSLREAVEWLEAAPDEATGDG